MGKRKKTEKKKGETQVSLTHNRKLKKKKRRKYISKEHNSKHMKNKKTSKQTHCYNQAPELFIYIRRQFQIKKKENN